MAYEVIKTIGTRQYRYRVQSERDPASGKTRNRWTYLGRVASERDSTRTPPTRGNSRVRLLAAAEGLLASGDAAAVTVDAIASAAGLAHGTFYRCFHDRADLLHALARHIRDGHGIGDDQLLVDDVATAEAARAGLRRWVVGKLQFARENRGIVCAWHALIAADERLGPFREERREALLVRLGRYLDMLRAKRFAQIADSAALAAGLAALLDGVLRASVLEADRLDDAAITAVADIAERAVYARL